MKTMLFTYLTTALLATACSAAATVEGGCIKSDPGLRWLESVLSPESVISCRGQPAQLYNAGRYWGTQFSKNASVAVFPACTQDVSYTLQATRRTPLGKDFTFVGGAHGMINASSSNSFIVDLSYMNKTEILSNWQIPGGNTTTVISYQGGANWEQVLSYTAGSGFTAVGARDSKVGVGGFSTGGGIGFLAGAYGYATDRLRALEVVLVSGQIVNATATNEYSDLFWALHGGNGQFGVVTTFYQEAAPEPKSSQIGVFYLGDGQLQKAQENTVEFFETNTDPFSLMYYATGFVPPNLETQDPASFAARTIIVALRFDNPEDPNQPDYNTTFAKLFAGIEFSYSKVYDVPYTNATQLVDPFFPYGFRRGFYGPQTSAISVPYLNNITTIMTDYINALVGRGEFPATTVFVMQYMSPGLNGNLPKSDADTAWPHAVAGHQTLFSPAWLKAEDDDLNTNTTNVLNKLTYDRQAELKEFIADYPNYISPGVSGSRVFGDNLDRLAHIKQKYDPECQIHIGRVFASPACLHRGYANFFADSTTNSSQSGWGYGHGPGTPTSPPAYRPSQVDHKPWPASRPFPPSGY